MNSIDDVVKAFELAKNVTLITFLVGTIIGVLKGIWHPGSEYRARVSERDKSDAYAEKVTTEALATLKLQGENTARVAAAGEVTAAAFDQLQEHAKRHDRQLEGIEAALQSILRELRSQPSNRKAVQS